MVKRHLSSIALGVLFVTVAVVMLSTNWVAAQETRSIVPYPRDVVVEAVDPVSKAVMRSYCIGPNAIDIKLTNNSGYRKYVYVINRDTRGVERTLYRGWLESGTQYLSTLLGTQFELSGPEGTEMVRVDVSEYGRIVTGNQVSFYVRNCGGTGPGPGPGPGPWPGHAQVWARVYPYAIEQGKKGTITLQTTVESRQNMVYYFEILNSWGQLWKRIPVSKRPYERYQITLPVGKSTKTGMLTYTVKLWLESGFQGERRNVATTRLSFRVVTPGSAPSQYESGYPSYPGYPGYQQGWTPYSGTPYSGTPYSEIQQPYYGTSPYSYGTTPYESYPYGTGYYGTDYYGTGYYPGSPVGERQIQ
jgi:hypothetical protein